jgi:hypothetical protein
MGRYSSHSRRAKHGFSWTFELDRNIAQCQDVNMNLGRTRNVPELRNSTDVAIKSGETRTEIFVCLKPVAFGRSGSNCSE